MNKIIILTVFFTLKALLLSFQRTYTSNLCLTHPLTVLNEWKSMSQLKLQQLKTIVLHMYITVISIYFM